MWGVYAASSAALGDNRWFVRDEKLVDDGGYTRYRFYKKETNTGHICDYMPRELAEIICDQLNIRDYGACESETVVGSKQ